MPLNLLKKWVCITLIIKCSDFVTVIYKLCTGAVFDIISRDQIVSYSFPERLNHYIQLKDRDLTIALIDCSASRNFCIYQLFSKTIEQLTDKEWGIPPDPIENWNQYLNHLKTQVNFNISS